MLLHSYQKVRERTVRICLPLQIEDYVVQPVVDVSPPKWHLGHTTWFFETLVLKPFLKGYQEYDANYNYIFNSYYESLGSRVVRTDRGNLSRPTVQDIYHYRQHVDEAMTSLLQKDTSGEVQTIITLGLNHEQQHQELLVTDIKYILGHNPLFPVYEENSFTEPVLPHDNEFIRIEEGVYEVGYRGSGFCFDNELQPHGVFINPFYIRKSLVTNGEYLDFILDGGYENFRYWHSEGWEWVKGSTHKCPLYWHKINGKWYQYTLSGLQPIDPDTMLCHINFFEASAFAEWKGCRLPSEFEWEAAAHHFDWGNRWEWTNSAYLPYPGFSKREGPIGEYNGKFMVNQIVLRGASIATPPGHSRVTYRNFFHPHLQWQFAGIRLAT